MKCDSVCTRPRSISSSVGPSAASRAISSAIAPSISASAWPGAGTGWNLLEVRANERERRVGIDVAGERNGRVGRMVVPLKKRADLAQPGGLEIRDLADRRPVVRMIGRKERAEHRHRREAVRT